MHKVPVPSCVEAAYERKCLEEGYYFKPIYPENQAYLDFIRNGSKQEVQRVTEMAVAQPTKNNTPIHVRVIQDITARAEFGKKKYGKYITPHDGDDYLQHLYEELLDAAHYIKAMIEERKTK